MKTAECEASKSGRLACELVRRQSVSVSDGRPQPEGRGGNRALRREDGGVRSAQLPGRHDHDLRAAGEEDRSGNRERRHAGQRRRVGINRDASGIVELDGELQLKPDHIIEIDNKSITHRPDLWGHVGMAREVAAISRKPLRDPVHMTCFQALRGDRVAIEDLDLLSAIQRAGVRQSDRPAVALWLQYRSRLSA